MATNHIIQAMANPEIITELGRRFKEYRLTYKLTQKEAADKAGVRTGKPIISTWATFLRCCE